MEENCKTGTKSTDSTYRQKARQERLPTQQSRGNYFSHTDIVFKPSLYDTTFTKILSKSFVPSNKTRFGADHRLWMHTIFAFRRLRYITRHRRSQGVQCVHLHPRAVKNRRNLGPTGKICKCTPSTPSAPPGRARVNC